MDVPDSAAAVEVVQVENTGGGNTREESPYAWREVKLCRLTCNTCTASEGCLPKTIVI